MATQDTNQSADQLFFQADELIKQQKIAEAKETLERALETDPKHGRAYNHLGWLYDTKYRDYAKADELYQKALEFAPEYPAVYLNYAIVLSALEKYEELEALMKKAEHVPGIVKDRVYNELGLLKEDQGKYDEAIDLFKQSIAKAKSMQDIESYKENMQRCEVKKEALA